MNKYLERKLSDFDWVLLIPVGLLLTAGLVALYSIQLLPESKTAGYLWRQIIWAGLGMLFFAAAFLSARRLIFNLAYVFYALAVTMLVLTLVLNRGMPVKRWLIIGGITFQFSEPAKIALILALARYLSERKQPLRRVITLLPALGMTLLMVVLVAAQPDLGTAMVYVVIFITMIFWAGLDLLVYFLLLAPAFSILSSFSLPLFFGWMLIFIGVLYVARISLGLGILNFLINLGVAGMTNLLWGILKPYQQQRILASFNANADPLGAGYQVSQSLTAFGAGGVYGRGFGHGTQTHLRFLPEQHTDFIMTVIGEEFGYIAVVAVLILLLVLISRLLQQAGNVRFRFDGLVLFGTAVFFAFHAFTNLAMIVGLLPVTGIPLPFISYGGSFLVSCLLLLGIGENLISSQRL